MVAGATFFVILYRVNIVEVEVACMEGDANEEHMIEKPET